MINDRKGRRESARLKLRERYFQRESIHGKRNANPGEKLPVGQTETRKWPVLDLGIQPKIHKNKWRLRIDGAVHNPCTLNWSQFIGLDHISDVSDFHCVTTWSKFDMAWVGLPFWRVVELVNPKRTAQFVLCHGADGYTTNLNLDAALEPDVLLVHTYDGKPLSRAHGGPCRMITPQLYAWKGTKWIDRIQFLESEQLGYWEVRGYSNTADPWTDDRYSGDPID